MRKLMKNSSDIVIHIKEELDIQKQNRLTKDLKKVQGIVSAKLHKKRPHLMIVSFDHHATKALNVLDSVKEKGVDAQLVGWV